MMFELRSPLQASARHRRWGFIGLSAAPFVGAVLYRYGYHLPLRCPVLALTGIPCPTCGMTRSFVAIVNGNLSESIRYHAFGWVLFASFLLVIFHLLMELRCDRAISTFYTRLLSDRRFQISALLVYFSYYGLRLYWLHSAGEFYANLFAENLCTEILL
ncbi:MAG: DUF2752 domain-containing protein [Leptolyngbyaceae cyanobacterium SM1_3_5]|nr:DUF2752 domain-containing protein [Leptolyngbyaceae cyanobacterium SM1_3_5]